MNPVFILLVIASSSPKFTFATTYTCDTSSTCGCSSVSTIVTSRIVGGEAASNNAWGWMLSLRYYGSHTCGATLLSAQYAVTAAHCVYNLRNNPSSLSILAGTNTLNDVSSSTAQLRAILKITIHPNYDMSATTYDVAVLQFSPLTISADSPLAFICLPTANQDPFQDGTSLVAIGWGVTYENSSTLSPDLQQVTVQVIATSSTACSQSGLTNSAVQFCAGVTNGGKDTCQGDSGGPLMAFVNNRWVMGGSTSLGYGCARANYPGVYARISALVTFINANINSATTTTTAAATTTKTAGSSADQAASTAAASNSKKNTAIAIDRSRFLLAFCSCFWIFCLFLL